jgi:hypothetical protein
MKLLQGMLTLHVLPIKSYVEDFGADPAMITVELLSIVE